MWVATIQITVIGMLVVISVIIIISLSLRNFVNKQSCIKGASNTIKKILRFVISNYILFIFIVGNL